MVTQFDSLGRELLPRYITDSGGTEVTETTGHSVKVTAQSNSGVDIGDVDVASIAAGTNVIGKVLPAHTVVETSFTGTQTMLAATHKLAPGVAYKVLSIELHNNAAPTTGTQNLVITLDSGTSSAYDVVVLTIGLVANAVTDLIRDFELYCKSTDVITAAWDNTDGKTWGLTFKHEVTG